MKRTRLTVPRVLRILGVSDTESSTRHSAKRLASSHRRILELAKRRDDRVLRMLAGALYWQFSAVDEPAYSALSIECRNGCLAPQSLSATKQLAPKARPGDWTG